MCERGQETQTGPNGEGVGQREMDDEEFGKRGVCCGRVEVGNGADDDANDKRSPDKAQETL